ncbi:MAG: PfkB family carbohydrate kinase [Eubacteriaceae bacterium]|nr:PfkB family carbohydrate kinase [Eubacteriaceae bacterium]
MKKILVIGSTVADIIVKLEHMPKTAEDVNVESQESSLGGCAYNVSEMIRHFKVPYILFSPIGGGIYGEYVANQLALKGLKPPLAGQGIGDNGCCYCFVEDTGERTFICHHGAEYLFKKEWFDALDTDQISMAYICGLEIEDKTGDVIVSFLEEHPEIQVCFAPGPRICYIDRTLMDRLFALHPIIHLNEDEVCGVTGCDDIKTAAIKLHEKTGNLVIVTHGSQGSYCYDGSTLHFAEPVKADNLVDTIGAGDAHCGASLAGLAGGLPIAQVLADANKAASLVVQTKGASLSDEIFEAAFK